MSIWKQIKNFEGYEINPHGEVRSLSYNKTKKTKLLLPNKNYYTLHGPDGMKSIKVSRLVAQAFLGLDIDNRDICVLHKDCDRTNNKVNNLLLGATGDGQKHYLLQKSLITHKKRRTDINYKNQTEEIFRLKNEGFTLSKISEQVGLSTSYLSMILNGKRRVYQENYTDLLSR